MADDTTGKAGGSDSPFNLGSITPLAGAAGGGIAALLMGGGGPQLPPQFGDIGANASTLTNEAGQLYGEGQSLIRGGQSALIPAMQGVLTPEQQASLTVANQKLGNEAAQLYASMGRNPNQDTSMISTQTDIQTKLLAASNAFVQTNIDAAFKEIGAGNSLTATGNQAMSQADSALLEEAKLQMQADKEYSDSLTSAFSAIGQIFGGVAGMAAGGPAGASIGMSLGRAL